MIARMVNSRGGNVDLLVAEDNTEGVEAHKMEAVELLQNDYHSIITLAQCWLPG